MVLGQQERVETIHTFLRSISDASDQNQTPNFAYYDRAFKELIGVYKRLNPCDAIANNRVPELLNDTVLNELCEKVNAIRNIVMGI